MNNILTKCPACNERLYIASLKCEKCGLELKNNFEISKYDLLDKEQHNFLETFLVCEGNLKELQNRLNISYPLAKKKLTELLVVLQLKERNNTEVTNMKNDIRCGSHTAAEIIKNRLIKKYPNKKLMNSMAETEMCEILKFYKLWNCGLLKYVYYK